MKKMMRKKGQIWISAVLYILIAAVVMVLVLEAGLPLLESMRDRVTFQKTKDSMITIDQHIKDIVDEGLGSQRAVPIEVRQGELKIEDNRLKWEMDSKSKILEPRTHVSFGNVIIASNVDVEAEDHGSYYVLENSRIMANLTKGGTPTNLTSIYANDIIRSVTSKDGGTTLSGVFTFTVGACSDPSYLGYTELVPAGNNTLLGDAAVIVHINPNASSCSYNLELILESQAVFLRVDLKDFKP